MWKYNLVIILFLAVACQNNSSNLLANKIEIIVSKDSSALILKNIDEYIIKELAADTLSTAQWQSNIAVYKKVEEDLQDLENPLAGKYAIVKNNIVFRPSQPFKKAEYYLVAIYMQKPDDNLLNHLKGTKSLFNNQPIQKTIKF
ncbi:hypothetical protein [Pedobacter alpinus]|uniref:Uncharacterized protein n=1 Tax=Pedobacter alpinus TaxID=1590643 RepID=A0ABW5TMB9_9SPHI